MPPGAKAKDAPKSMGEAMAGFGHAYKTFFQKKLIWRMLALAFFYRFGWYLIEKVNNLFLLADRAKGGLGLTDQAAGQSAASGARPRFWRPACLAAWCWPRSAFPARP